MTTSPVTNGDDRSEFMGFLILLGFCLAVIIIAVIVDYARGEFGPPG